LPRLAEHRAKDKWYAFVPKGVYRGGTFAAMDQRTGTHRENGGAERELAELRASLAEVCRQRQEWPDKLAAGIYAALDFATADPDRALGLLARDGKADGEAYRQTVDCLIRMLDEVVPTAASAAGGSAGSVEGIAMIVSEHLRAERADGLGQIAPALVEFALQPYLGYGEAKRWADRGDGNQR